ncbi:MAG: hypothetical protein Q9177_002344 [Variospora cf. flavescens]
MKTQRSSLMQPNLSDPFPANEDALAAASYAFGRRAGPESNSNASQIMAIQHRISDQEPPLARSKSIRFAGPTALPCRDLSLTLREPPTGRFDRRRSLDPHSRRNNPSLQGDDGTTVAPPAYGENGETHPPPQPSSYRKLRKSKSMFSPRTLSTPNYNTALPVEPFHTSGHIPSAVEKTGQARVHTVSRLGRSFSFLRPHTDYRPTNSAYQEEAIGLARDQYLQQAERQNLESNPWGRDAAVRRRSQKSFKKTLRTRSTNNQAGSQEAPRSPTKQRSEQKGVGIKARDLSSSFKNRLKRVFNRSMGTEAAFPAQHLQATRLHFGGIAAPFDSPEMLRKSVESLHRSTPDRSSPQPLDPLHVPRRRGSIARHVSVGSGDLSADAIPSRATSWTNSTTPTTLSVHQPLERRQLPIIRADVGMALRLGHAQQAAYHQHDATIAESQPRKSSLYLKLQQRMSKGNSKARLQPLQIGADGKHNPSVDDLKLPSTGPPETFEVRNRRVNDQPRVHSSISIAKTPPSAGRVEERDEPIFQEYVNDMPKGPLHESNSIFFPQKTHIERSRTSPFREAMRHKGPIETASVPKDVLSPDKWHEHLSSPHEAGNKSVARSESIYSQTSSGNTPERHKSSESLVEFGKCSESHLASPTSEAAAEWRESSSEPAHRDGFDAQERVSEQRLLPDTDDSSRSRKASARVKQRSGHKREHAQITGEDADIGRLHHVPREPDSSSLGGLINFHTHSPIKHASSQPMVDRFPLISINTRPNTKQNGRNVPLSLKATTCHAEKNVSHQAHHQLEWSRENKRPQWSGPDSASRSSNPTLDGIKDRGNGDNRTGLEKSVHSSNTLFLSTPESQNGSSPERMVRLRRMYSSSNIGSPSAGRRSGKLRPKLQPDEDQQEHRTACEAAISCVKPRRAAPGGKLDLISDGRNMVDAFLETRRKSQNEDVGDTVFV